MGKETLGFYSFYIEYNKINIFRSVSILDYINNAIIIVKNLVPHHKSLCGVFV